MDCASATIGPVTTNIVNQKCPKCNGAMLVLRLKKGEVKHLRSFQCKDCGHQLTNANVSIRARLLTDQTIKAIRWSTDDYQLLAQQYGCSRELIRQIRNGEIYRDLLPEGFRSPPKASDPTCYQCIFYVPAKPEQIEVEGQCEHCYLGIPEFETEGVRAAWDCSALVSKQQPPHSGPTATEPISDPLLS
jgi:transposase-like protein